MTAAPWSAERLTGVWPDNNWRFTREGDEPRTFTLHGEQDAVMHVLEALNAYERPPDATKRSGGAYYAGNVGTAPTPAGPRPLPPRHD